MKFTRSFNLPAMLAVLAVSAGSYAPASFADDNVATMAGVVLSLQHFPSDAAKGTLAAIADGDASDGEKIVATAIAGIQHKVSAGDKAALEAISADESQPADLRRLAGIIAALNHAPSADAKAALMELSGG